MNLPPEVYVALFVAVLLIATLRYDSRRRAKRDAEGRPNTPAA